MDPRVTWTNWSCCSSENLSPQLQTEPWRMTGRNVMIGIICLMPPAADVTCKWKVEEKGYILSRA